MGTGILARGFALVGVLLLVASISGIAGCGGADSGGGATTATEGHGSARDATTARVAFVPAHDSGADVRAAFTDTPDGVRVEFEGRNLPDPEATYVIHLSTADSAGAPPEEVEYHLRGFRPPGPDGRASNIDFIGGVTVRELFSGRPKRYVDVRRYSGSGDDTPRTACARSANCVAFAPLEPQD